ncbi:alpha/beta fold hydrolase [Pseudonocardia sp.]|uniref:alpha/beta fold hydrolase n=1 Tax=Pseudonocardia sp. TaxID=60912 RepID=UPI003D0AE4A9
MITAFDEVVRLGTREVHVSVSGTRGTSPPLLLLMGLGGNSGMWQPLRGMLDASRVTVAFDVPGTGRSPAGALPLLMPHLARLALAVLDHVGMARVDVMGVSWGGALAQQLAVTGRRRVRRLVLANTHFGIGSMPASPGAMRTLLSVDRYHDPDALADAARHFGGKAAQMGAGMREHSAARLAHPPSRRGYLYQMLAISTWSSLPMLPAIRKETLLLAGGDDPAVPAVNAKIMKRIMPRAELVIVPDGGHLMLFDQAAELAPIVTDFLDRP